MSVTVPANNVAHLMYYLGSVTRSLGMDVLPARLLNFNRWASLSDEEDDEVYKQAWRFSPDELLDAVIFHDEDGTLCETASNRFLEISEATSMLAVSGSAVVGGTKRTATKIMVFTTPWLRRFYIDPMRAAAGRLTRLRVGLILHCRHCRGAATTCACTDGCARREWSECIPRRAAVGGASLAALVEELAGARLSDSGGGGTRHCVHCRGLAGGKCGCGVCPRSATTRCIDHCAHCWGLLGACDCKSGCARLGTTACTPVSDHCAHCVGGSGKCACGVCPRRPASRCVDHCAHCWGTDGHACGCKDGCPRLATTACTPRHTAWCDGCGVKENIAGNRYKCGVCEDLDFCASCYAADRRHRRHPFLRWTDPRGKAARLAPREASPPPRPRPTPPRPAPPPPRPAPPAATAAAAAVGCRRGFRVGERVVLAGLKAGDMNGAAAVIVEPVSGGGRAEVRLVAGDRHYNIRYENLRGAAVDLD